MADHLEIHSLYEKIKAEFSRVVVGQEAVLRLMLSAYLSRGHVIFEGVPGIAKTLMVKSFAHIIGGEFKRIQFTPDLLPADIIGTMVFDAKESRFYLHKGPIFANFILADEVNRTPPKTQSALLEAMQERQVSIEGNINPLPKDFTVFATQNPIEYEGTYPLPEAQLDRFMMRVRVSYPTEDEELTILRRYDAGFDPMEVKSLDIKSLNLSPGAEVGKVPGSAGNAPASRYEELLSCVSSVKVREEVLAYILEIVRRTRERKEVILGASPRAGIFILKGAKVLACLDGRDFVTPDDVAELVPHVLNHRIILAPEYEIEGITVDSVISDVLHSVPVPR